MSSHKILRTQSRKVLHNVHKFMAKEAKTGPLYDFKDIVKRTSKATGMSIYTVQKILNHPRISEDILSKYRNKLDNKVSKNIVSKVNSFNLEIIKQCVYNFYITGNVLPTLVQLVRTLKKGNNFQGSIHVLRSILKELGFKKYRINRNHSVLIERTNIRLKRIEYLESISKFRMEGRNIIYAGESCIDYCHTSTSKLLNDNEGNRLQKNKPKAHRLIIAHAASNVDFVPNALLTLRDCSTRMNYESCEKWIRNKVLPNIPQNSVIVLSDASNHNKLDKTVLTPNSSKLEIKSWLTEKGVPFSSEMLKPQLYKLVSLHKDYKKIYQMDYIIENNWHNVLRLPPHHSELNPINLIFKEINDYVVKYKDNLNLNTVKKLINEKCTSMEKTEWSTFFEKVKTIEEKYKSMDVTIDTLTDELNFHDGDESDVNSDDSDQDTDVSLDDSLSEEDAFCSNEESIDNIKVDIDTLDPLRR